MHGKVTGVTGEKVAIPAVICLSFHTQPFTKGITMEKSAAVNLAQQAVIEAIKGGVLPVFSSPNARNGEAAADFIITAHQKLTAYYEKSDLQTQ
jgi:hypothetical protein